MEYEAEDVHNHRLAAHDEPLPEGCVAELPPRFCAEWLGGGRWVRIGSEGRGSCFFWSVCVALNHKNFNALDRDAKRAVCNAFRCGLAQRIHAAMLEDVRAELKDTRSKFATGLSPAQLEEELCSPAVWGNEKTIRFTSHILGVNLMFLNASAGAFHCGVHSRAAVHSVLSPTSASAQKAKPSRAALQHHQHQQQPAVLRDAAAPHDAKTILIWWNNKCRHFEALARLVDAPDGRKSNTLSFTALLQPSCVEAHARAVQAIIRVYAARCAARGTPVRHEPLRS
jgi:hypothetical protein